MLFLKERLSHFFLIFIFSASFFSQDINALEKDINLSVKNINRIVALSPHSVEILYAMGLGDKIVGTVEYADYPKQALKIPRIGNYSGIQMEKLLQLAPDLVVTWKSGNKSTDLEKMKSLGLKLVNSDPKNIADIFTDIDNLAMIIGNKKQASELVAKLKADYQAIKQQYIDLPKIKVFYQLWHDPLQTIGPKSSISSLIRDCGGENIFSQVSSAYPTVSIESVLVKNPKVIIIPHHSGSKSEKQLIWSKWPEITAVKNNHIFVLDGDLIHRFTPRTLEGLQRLCQTVDQGRINTENNRTTEK